MESGIKNKKRYISANRLFFVLIVIFLLAGASFWRLYYLQVEKHHYFTDLASRQYKIRKHLLSNRGKIFFQDKEKLVLAAINKNMPTVFIIPSEVKNDELTANQMSQILHVDLGVVKKKIAKKNDPYEVIKKKISEQELEKIKEANLPGVHLEDRKWRYYPNGKLASQTLGFLGYDGNKIVGRYGVEQEFDKVLRGKNGIIEESGDAKGNWIAIGHRRVQPSLDGNDLVLTIDPNIQFKAEMALENAIKKHQADSGKIIVTEPKTGKILAMASYPSFDPNKYSEADIKTFSNPVISSAYEPGSVFKIITMVAGIDAEKVSPNTVYTDSGVVKVAGFNIRNSDHKAYGKQTMTEVIEKSLNTGVIFVEKLLGHKLFKDYVEKFGFGVKTGIALPNEASGNIDNLNDRGDVSFFTASYGQGITVTPLQLAMAYGAIANKGLLMKPILISDILNQGKTVKRNLPQEIRQIISEESAKQAALMLEANVKNGHGKLAAVPGYRVAGKTGTAQIPDHKNGGYIEGATIGTFAGFAPVDNPVFVMVVVIDHPRDIEWAAGTAAPVFGDLSKFLLNYFNIEPTEEYTKKDLEIFAKKHEYLKIKIEADDKSKNDKKMRKGDD